MQQSYGHRSGVTVKAFRLMEWQKPPELVDVDLAEPGPGQVLIRVGGAGACHSDLHLMEWPAGRMPYAAPFTLGHENAGWVERLGPGAHGFASGDPVAVYGPWGCGHCANCIQGMDNCCENWRMMGARGGGLGRDGGMAEYMLIPQTRFLVPLHTITPAEAAPLTDAALTPYHAIKRALPILRPGSAAVVIGVGGLGHLAVQILAALTPARVIAVDLSQQRLSHAQRAGAQHAIVAGPDAVEEIRDVNGGRGADLVLDVVGSDVTLAIAAKVCRTRGQLTLVGAATGSIPFGFFEVPQECSLTVSSWGTLPELVEVIALTESGRITPQIHPYPLDRAADAYAALARGELTGRAVIVPVGG
jgi:propanol-preferring alcohol dehydrogenase